MSGNENDLVRLLSAFPLVPYSRISARLASTLSATLCVTFSSFFRGVNPYLERDYRQAHIAFGADYRSHKRHRKACCPGASLCCS